MIRLSMIRPINDKAINDKAINGKAINDRPGTGFNELGKLVDLMQRRFSDVSYMQYNCDADLDPCILTGKK